MTSTARSTPRTRTKYRRHSTSLDAAYRTKYQRYGENYVGLVVSPGARATTLKLVPR